MSEKLIMQIKTGKSEVQLYRSGSAVRVHTFSSNGAADLTGKEALQWWNCLLYTSDAADEEDSVELAQEKNNKFKWHDWNLVVRKCHREQWHKKQIQEDTPHTSYDMGEFEERAAPLPVYRRKKETD